MNNNNFTFNPSKLGDYISIIYGFGLFLLCQPFFIWNINYFQLFILIIVVSISLYYHRRFYRIDIVVFPLFLFYFAYMSLDFTLFGFIARTSLLSIIYLREDKVIVFYKWFKNFFVVSVFISLITYVLIVFVTVPVGYKIIEPLNSLKISYFQYPFLVAEFALGFSNYNIRFAGMFSEPGIIGSISVMLLFADNYNLKSKQNIILLIAGIFSFSFFFIVSSLIYLIYNSSIKIRIMLALVIGFSFFSTMDNPIINKIVWERFKIENGELQGDNRSSNELDAIYLRHIQSSDMLWGKGNDFTWSNNLMESASYKLVILNYGVFFFVILILANSLFAIFIIKKPKYILGFLILFYGMLYQRPGFIYDGAFIFIFAATAYGFKQIAYQDTLALYDNKLVN